MIDKILFDCVISFPLTVTVICVRIKVSIHPRISDDVVMRIVFKGGVFEFLGSERTKNGVSFVIRASIGLGLFQCTKPKFHI